MIKLQTRSLHLCQKDEPHYCLICLHLRSRCFKLELRWKTHNFEIEWILCYSKHCVFYFQPLLLARWSDGWSIFYETKMIRLINTVCFWVRLIKGYMEITAENKQWKVQCIVHENNMKITVPVCWYLNKLAYRIVQLVCNCTFLYYWRFTSQKNSNYFLSYRSIYIIIWHD